MNRNPKEFCINCGHRYGFADEECNNCGFEPIGIHSDAQEAAEKEWEAQQDADDGG